jgi:hypothetical protein
VNSLNAFFRNFLIALTVIVLLSSCSSGGLQSSSYKAKGVDLKKYKTFAWAKPADVDSDSKKDDKLYGDLILQLSNDELQKKGFVLNTEQPDAVFIFDTHVEDRVVYSQSPQVSMGIGFGGPGYYGGFAAPVAGGAIKQNTVKEGMLHIEMYDTQTKKLLWRGMAQEEITYKNDIEADIRQAVKFIFMRLPVKHK